MTEPNDQQSDFSTGRWRIACVFVLAAAILIYAGSWTGALVWDDHYLVDGSAIGGGKSLLSCFTTPFLNHYFRPLISVFFFFERKLWHDSPLGYRIVSTLLHAAATGLLLGLLRDAFDSRRAALAGTLLFALQPVQIGAVAWIGGRTDALCEIWLLLFGWCLVRAAQTVSARRGKLLGWAVIFFTLAVFTKEQTLALLPLVPLAFRCWKPRDGANLSNSEFVFTLPFAAICGVYLVLGYHLGMPRPSFFPLSMGEYFAQAGQILAYYTLVLLVPTPQLLHTLSLGALEQAGAWPVVLGYCSLAACAFLLWKWRRSNPACAWFLALAVLSLVPVSGFVPLPFLLVAPYRAAIAGIGVAALAGRWLAGSRDRASSPALNRRPSPALPSLILGAILLWQGGLTAWGAIQWRDEVTLFHRIVRADPDGIVTRYILASMVGDRGNYGEAATELEATLQNLFGSDAWKNADTAARAVRDDPRILMRARQNQGSTDEPHIWLAFNYNTLAHVYLKQGQTFAGLAAYRAAEAMTPRDAEIQSGIGYCEGLLGHDDEAVRRMKAALSLDPNQAYAHEWLGRYYVRLANWDAAVPQLRAWAKAVPDSADAKTLLRDAEAQSDRRKSLKSGGLFHQP